jgi:hypothetical protein
MSTDLTKQKTRSVSRICEAITSQHGDVLARCGAETYKWLPTVDGETIALCYDHALALGTRAIGWNFSDPNEPGHRPTPEASPLDIANVAEELSFAIQRMGAGYGDPGEWRAAIARLNEIIERNDPNDERDGVADAAPGTVSPPPSSGGG